MDDGCKKEEKQEEKVKNGNQKKNEKREKEVLEQNVQGREQNNIVVHYTYEFNN